VKVSVFDLDDTLYLERDYVRSGFVAVGEWVERTHEVGGFGARCWELFEAGHRGSTFDAVLAEQGLDPLLAASLVEEYRRHPPQVALLPDVADALVAARGVGGVAILTDGAPASQRAKLASLGLDPLVDVVVVTDELGGPHLRKPHRAGFDAVMAGFPDAAPADFTYFADNPGKDRVGAEAVGWRFVRVRRTGGLHVDVEDDGTCRTAPDLTAALAIAGGAP
jgi:putative hydrolase of the HAD superfamily